jgi:hypothetical protein
MPPSDTTTKNLFEVKVGAFTYKLKLQRQADQVVFDIFDNVIVKGNVMPEVIGSGKIDVYGRCKFEVYCDVHAAMAMGDIMKFAYEKSAELMAEDE